MTYLFHFVLFVIPIPVCWILYKYLHAHKSELSGRILKSIKVEVSGPIATYIAVIISSIFVVDPALLDLNLSHEATIWDFELLETGEKETISHGSGVLSLKNGPGQVVRVSGTLDNEGQSQIIKEEIGLIGEDVVYFPIGLPGVRPAPAALGPLGVDRDHMSLNLYGLRTAFEGAEGTSANEIVLKRKWPFVHLFVVVLVPLLVIFALGRIGPLTAFLSGSTASAPGFMRRLSGDLRFKIGGASAGYIIVFFISAFFLKGVPNSLGEDDGNSSRSCQNISGKWNFNLYHFYDTENRNFLDHAGEVNVNCGDSIDELKIYGRVNEMFNRNRPYADADSCYRKTQEGTGGQNWRTIVNGIDGIDLVSIYSSGIISDQNKDLGVLVGQVGNDDQQKWSFYDFIEEDRYSYSINVGDLVLFRPDSDQYLECDEISKMRLEESEKFFQ